MLTPTDLKTWLHKPKLKQLDKLLLVLAAAGGPCGVKDIKASARQAGLKITASWNPSSTFARSGGLAISTPNGWELTDAGKSHVRSLGVADVPVAAAQTAHDLRAELANVADADTHRFVEEAVTCFEHRLYRSAVVMSWLAATHVLYRHVHGSHLARFNAEAARIDTRWKPAVTIDDLGKMKESDFLDRMMGLSLLGKNVRKQLGNCLDLRNACGHPNSLKLSVNTVASHLEFLLLNVFQKYA